jgi:hypothetical protein
MTDGTRDAAKRLLMEVDQPASGLQGVSIRWPRCLEPAVLRRKHPEPARHDGGR